MKISDLTESVTGDEVKRLKNWTSKYRSMFNNYDVYVDRDGDIDKTNKSMRAAIKATKEADQWFKNLAREFPQISNNFELMTKQRSLLEKLINDRENLSKIPFK